MTYQTNIPEGASIVNTTVAPIRTNFSQYQSVFNANHTALNTADQGKHERVILIQGTSPDVTGQWPTLFARNASTFLGSQLQLYAKVPVFLTTDITGTNIPNPSMQITYNQVVNSGVVTPSASNPYQSFFMGGYLIYFNRTTISGATTITLSPKPTKILSVIAQNSDVPVSPPTGPQTASITILNNFQFSILSANAEFQWICIAQD